MATHYRRRATSEKRTYDQVKRKRKTSWQKNRNWLVHNSEIDRMTCSVCIQYASSDRMMVTLVMMMFQVMTILTFVLHHNFFKYNNYYMIFSNCPHDGRASRISGGLVDFLYLLVLLASCNFCLNSTLVTDRGTAQKKNTVV